MKADRDERVVEERQRPRRLLNNWISLTGLYLVGLAVVLLITFWGFTLLVGPSNPYLDIVGFLVLPGFVVMGLAVVPLGMILAYYRRRRRRPGQVQLPHVNLNEPRTRNVVLVFVGASIFIVLPILGISSYEGYHYTESSEFCGQVCHQVMEPQATTYATSPHARVSCAECHIGSGASWFVKSKLSGTRQILAVMQESYPRPIPPAITELRPARDTCEQCHWPAKFFGSQYREVVHYIPDEESTRRRVRMLLKTGGADASLARVEGIHAHMVLNARIEYIATDEKLQNIPWVRYEEKDGRIRIFRSDGLPSDATPPDGIRRQMDCMDCHNRGAHHFKPPQAALDLYLEAGRIDPSLPYIKREAVARLVADYPDVATAEQEIRTGLQDFYAAQYPDVKETKSAAIEAAIAAVQEIYRSNFFPYMRVDWRTYPENIGHLNSPGCLRCHDGRHVDQNGHAVSSDCDICHTFLQPAAPNSEHLIEGPFEHTLSLALHKNLRCDQCHSGGTLLLCRDCHGSGQWLEEAGQERFRRTP